MNALLDQMYEATRNILINSNNLDSSVNKIQDQNARLLITEMIKTVQADLLILLELLGEISNSFESEMDEIIRRYSNE